MHQLACGVDDTISIDGYLVKIVSVTETEVRFGISTGGDRRRVHEITLPRTAVPQRLETLDRVTTR